MKGKIHCWWEWFPSPAHLYTVGEKEPEPQKKKQFMERNSQDPPLTQAHKWSNEIKAMYWENGMNPRINKSLCSHHNVTVDTPGWQWPTYAVRQRERMWLFLPSKKINCHFSKKERKFRNNAHTQMYLFPPALFFKGPEFKTSYSVICWDSLTGKLATS